MHACVDVGVFMPSLLAASTLTYSYSACAGFAGMLYVWESSDGWLHAQAFRQCVLEFSRDIISIYMVFYDDPFTLF